jgi:ELWxxDGT repeat protein
VGLLAAAWAGGGHGQAQVPYLVQDLNTNATPGRVDWGESFSLGDKAIFYRASGQTAAGTLSAVTFTHPTAFGDTTMLKSAGDHALFLADDGQSGLQLWLSNGTAAGTRRLTNFTAGDQSVPSSQIEEVNGQAVFMASDSRDGALPASQPLRGDRHLAGLLRQYRQRPGGGPDRRHRLLLVFLRRQRRGDRQGARRPSAQWQLLGVLRRPVEREVRPDGDRLKVTDTLTGAFKTYHNPSGQLASVADVSAF